MRPIFENPWVVISHPDAVKQVFNGPPELLHAGEGNRILLPVVGANSVLLLDDEAASSVGSSHVGRCGTAGQAISAMDVAAVGSDGRGDLGQALRRQAVPGQIATAAIP
jgi:hypothetical protein